MSHGWRQFFCLFFCFGQALVLVESVSRLETVFLFVFLFWSSISISGECLMVIVLHALVKSVYFNHPSQGNSTNYYLILGPRDKAAPPASQQIKKSLRSE